MTSDSNLTVRQSYLWAIVLVIAGLAFILSFSIAAPILIRPLYTLRIDSMHLTQMSGLTKDQIKEAYNEVLDYCIGRTDTFSAGILPYSQSGASHFADCRRLFILDFQVLAVSAALLLINGLVRLFMNRRKRLAADSNAIGSNVNGGSAVGCKVGRANIYQPSRLGSMGWPFYSGLIMLILAALLGICSAIDFERLFLFLHGVLFPGKTNWVFDPDTDPVINILPEEFFLQCMIVIAVLLVGLSIVFMLTGRTKKDVVTKDSPGES